MTLWGDYNVDQTFMILRLLRKIEIHATSYETKHSRVD